LHYLRLNIKPIVEELGFPQDLPMELKGNNMGAMAMARNPQFYKQSKHIATKWHWIHDLI
jgi:hypothetical protein